MLTHRTETIIGDIPGDWGRELLTNLLAEQKGGDWGCESGEVAVRVLRSTNFTDRGTIDFTDVATRYFAGSKAEAMLLKGKDLLLADLSQTFSEFLELVSQPLGKTITEL